MLLWSLMVFCLGQLAGMVAMLPRVDALQAQLEEREETVANLWYVYTGTHCALKEAELYIQSHLWPDVTWWPAGDASEIPCPTDPASSPLFASAEDPAQEGEASQPPAQERAAEARGRGRHVVVTAREGEGWDVSGADGEGMHR